MDEGRRHLTLQQLPCGWGKVILMVWMDMNVVDLRRQQSARLGTGKFTVSRVESPRNLHG